MGSYVYLWLGLMIAFGAVESITLGLTSLWFAIGALCALVAVLLGANIWIQLITFIAVSFLMLLYTRPLVKKFLKVGKIKTNSESLIGAMGVVVHPIEPFKIGQVKVNNQYWSAKDIEDRAIPVGETVEIMEIEGVKLIVRTTSDSGHQPSKD